MGLLLLDGMVFVVLQVVPAVPVPPALTGFAALMARVDRNVQRVLGSESMLYRWAAGAPVPVMGIFDERYVLVQGSAEAGVESVAPAVFLQLADLPSDPREDSPILTIRGRDYRVGEDRFAGMGSILLVLELVT